MDRSLWSVHSCMHVYMYPVVFNREELQYGTYEMSLWDYWWDEEGDEILGGDEVLE